MFTPEQIEILKAEGHWPPKPDELKILDKTAPTKEGVNYIEDTLICLRTPAKRAKLKKLFNS